ncbi:HNH endonuclease [Eubacterium sp.]|uniref:HNH endonuclease n=1 Tax=Eubacterium sp. TaxID=142586 RepID=UPI00338D4258
MPDFGPCSIATVQLEHMSIIRYINFSKCDKLCADYFNSINYLNCSLWTSSAVKQYRKAHSLSWHERNDRITCDLVPSKINLFFLHLGGVAECKRANTHT